MAETAKRIEPPIESDLGDNPGLVRFATYQDAFDWAEREADAWRCLANHRNDLPPISIDASLQRQEAIPRQIANAARHALDAADGADLADAHRRISNGLARYADGECLHAASPVGRLVLDLMGDDPQAALALLAAHTGTRILVADRGRRIEHDLMPVAHAVARAAVAEYGGPSVLKNQDAAFLALRDDWTALMAGKQAELEQIVLDVADWMDEQRKSIANQRQHLSAVEKDHERAFADHKLRLTELESDYTQRVGLRGAAAFWITKRRRFLTASILSAVAFPVTAGAIIYAVLWFALSGQGLIENLPGLGAVFAEPRPANDVLGPVATTIALGLFILFGIWVLQIISRVFLTSVSGMNDAGARVAMVQTYLALARDTSTAADGDRQIILRALFAGEAATPDDLAKHRQ